MKRRVQKDKKQEVNENYLYKKLFRFSIDVNYYLRTVKSKICKSPNWDFNFGIWDLEFVFIKKLLAIHQLIIYEYHKDSRSSGVLWR